LMAPGRMIPWPIVLATANPKMNGPRNSAAAANARAARGGMARDEIIVATMLLASFAPFTNALMNANIIIAIIIGDTRSARTQVIFTMISPITLAASSTRSAALLKWRYTSRDFIILITWWISSAPLNKSARAAR